MYMLDMSHTDSLSVEVARTGDWELASLVEGEARYLFEATLYAALIGKPLVVEAAFLNN